MNARQKKRVAKLVAALRSDEYKQGDSYLKQTQPNGDAVHCCLGVACELYLQNNELQYHDDDGWAYFGGEEGQLPAKVQKYYGFADALGAFSWSDGRKTSLADQNDDGKTFKQIAAIIERAPKGMFV